jgi:hypothetical protein
VYKFKWWIGLGVALLIVGAGLYTGYGLLGDQPVSEIFQPTTWQHLIDLIFAE